MATLVWAVGDRNPPLRTTLQNADGTPHDMTGRTASIRLRAEGATVNKVDAAMTVIAPATGGVVEYAPAAGDLDTPGRYTWQIKVTETATGKVQTFRGDAHIYVVESL